MNPEKVAKVKRDPCIENKHLCFLDDVRESGTTNMYGAWEHLMKEYKKLTKEQAKIILKYWMDTF